MSGYEFLNGSPAHYAIGRLWEVLNDNWKRGTSPRWQIYHTVQKHA